MRFLPPVRHDPTDEDIRHSSGETLLINPATGRFYTLSQAANGATGNPDGNPTVFGPSLLS